MKQYLPTPKMAGVLWTGLTVYVLVLIADQTGVNIRDEVATALPWLVAAAVGWAKRDASSPTTPADE